MGDYFKVELQSLNKLLQQLHASQEEMRTALNALRDTGVRTTGSGALDHACDEFHDSWDDAIKKIAEGTEQIESGLQLVCKTYADTEQALTDALKGKAGA
jgi:prefoldin subunit 5